MDRMYSVHGHQVIEAHKRMSCRTDTSFFSWNIYIPGGGLGCGFVWVGLGWVVGELNSFATE